MTRTAVVTGATQGLGLALVEGLAARMNPEDTVYLTGRHLDRVTQAVAAMPAGGAKVRGEVLDVTDPDGANRLAARVREPAGQDRPGRGRPRARRPTPRRGLRAGRPGRRGLPRDDQHTHLGQVVGRQRRPHPRTGSRRAPRPRPAPGQPRAVRPAHSL